MNVEQASVHDPYFPRHHRAHAKGWINDPNGIHKNGDTWHVFFQWNPYSARHSQIHWGHMTSTDLVHWQEQPAALVPRERAEDRAGCWSGVGLVDRAAASEGASGTPTLVYSGVDGVNSQFATAIVARGDQAETSFDRFVVAAAAPRIEGLMGIRDPFVLEFESHRYVIQGASITRKSGETDAVILGWLADDLENWVFLGEVAASSQDTLRDMQRSILWECPQLVPIDGRWVLIVGLWDGDNEGTDKPVLQGSGYAVGSLRAEYDADGTPCGLFFENVSAHGLVDEGPDFYAPQVYLDGDRALLWGWSWESVSRTQEETDAQGWAGCLTFPRELSLVGDRLVSHFPAEILAQADAVGVRAVGADGCRVMVVDASGTSHLVATLEGAGSIAVDGSIVEVLPADSTPATYRVYGEVSVAPLDN